MPLFDGQQGLFLVIVVSLFRKEEGGGGESSDGAEIVIRKRRDDRRFGLLFENHAAKNWGNSRVMILTLVVFVSPLGTA